MSEVRVIILHHQRHAELVKNQHPFSGSIELQDEDAGPVSIHPFVELPFYKMLAKVSEWLRKYPNAEVIFHRMERRGLKPLQLAEPLRLLLRDDPVAAIRQMDVQSGDPCEREPKGIGVAQNFGIKHSAFRSGYDTLADAFGERVFLHMRNGMIEDPIHATMLSLAYGPKLGWMIRGEKNDSSDWLAIRLEGVPDSLQHPGSSESEIVEELDTESLFNCGWASVEVQDLLNTGAERFYLPRAWNKPGPWISAAALRARLEAYCAERSQVLS